ncbi:MAG: hypothetical protein LBU65_01785 [Planctomycetaceae bacterium]|jgi:hypothetical protein|nr:hypothetical protein [Planctomycetaceae bacterium]
MFNSMLKSISLGQDAWIASLVYIGVAILAFALIPDIPPAWATSDCNCPDGQISVMTGEGCTCVCASDE